MPKAALTASENKWHRLAGISNSVIKGWSKYFFPPPSPALPPWADRACGPGTAFCEPARSSDTQPPAAGSFCSGLPGCLSGVLTPAAAKAALNPLPSLTTPSTPARRMHGHTHTRTCAHNMHVCTHTIHTYMRVYKCTRNSTIHTCTHACT